MKNSNINIKKVSGNITISQNQKGGITSQGGNHQKPNKERPSFFTNKYVLLIGFISAVLGIFAYFGYQPSVNNKNAETIKATDSTKIIHDTTKNKSTTIKK